MATSDDEGGPSVPLPPAGAGGAASDTIKGADTKAGASAGSGSGQGALDLDSPGPAAAAPADPVLGRVIGGNFRVAKLIGAGGMGRVYEAEQLSLGKRVALKLLHRELMVDEVLIKRFELEARNASMLSHPNSIQVIDFGREGDLLYIAMELLQGEDLFQVLAREGPMSAPRIGRIMEQVLAALDEAHAQGIVHRDLKPSNIMLLRRRRGDADYVKVCDFGIAKAQAPRDGETLTMKGLVCGTPEYMSPEQATGIPIDGRSDLYAVAVILYQMVTGQLPFFGTSAVAILSQHLTERPQAPGLRRPDLVIAQALEALILRGMEKDPRHRPQSAMEFRDELRAACGLGVGALPTMPAGAGATPTPTPVAGAALASSGAPSLGALEVARPRRRRTRSPWVPIVLFGATAIGAWGFFFLRPKPSPPAGPAPAVARAPAAEPAPPAGSPATDQPAAPSPGAAVAIPEAHEPAPGSEAPVAGLPRDGARSAAAVAAAGAKPALRPHAPHAPPAPPARAGIVPQPAAQAAPAARAQAAASPAPAQAGAGGAGADPAPRAGGHREAMIEAERLLGQGEVADACAKGEEAKRLSPGAPTCYKFLGKCYMRLGDTRRASEHYRRYLELAPDAPDAAFIRNMVR